MNRLPDALVVVDPNREHIAVKEAQRMGVTTVALIDTDSDPDPVDLPIPGNDDSIRSIELILAKLADAVLEGRAALPPEQQAHDQAAAPPPAAAASRRPPNAAAGEPANPPAADRRSVRTEFQAPGARFQSQTRRSRRLASLELELENFE